MARVQVTNVTVLDNPTHFLNPFQFEVTFECFEDLPEGTKEYVRKRSKTVEIRISCLLQRMYSKHTEFLFFSNCADLEWKIIYVGSAATEDYDQVLDSILVGPVPAGRHMFVFQVRLLTTTLHNMEPSTSLCVQCGEDED